jgi:hypothetical protein
LRDPRKQRARRLFTSATASSRWYCKVGDRATLRGMTDDSRVTIVVRSLYKELTAQGFDDRQILAVAIELVGKVTDRLAQDPQRRRA